jgi:hypothetical protein
MTAVDSNAMTANKHVVYIRPVGRTTPQSQQINIILQIIAKCFRASRMAVSFSGGT